MALGFRDKLTEGLDRAGQAAGAAKGAAQSEVARSELLLAATRKSEERLRAFLRTGDDEKITIELLLVRLVEAAQADEPKLDRSDKDLFKSSRSRRRRLGMLALPGGPIAGQLIELYCDIATLCELVDHHQLALDRYEIAGHALVLWQVMPDPESATLAARGAGQSVAGYWAKRALGHEALNPPEKMSPTDAVRWIWKFRSAVPTDLVKDRKTVRATVFVGNDTKEFIAKAREQLGVAVG